MRDPYEVLGVDRSSTADEIKAAFRKLASQHHPDRNPDDAGAQQRFKEINAAHQILSDPQKRAAYDRMGPSIFGSGGFQSPFGGVPFDMSNLEVDGIFGDLLGALGIKIGDRGTLKRELRITFEEAAFGCSKEMTYSRIDACVSCNGLGAAPGTTVDACGECGGKGRLRFQQGAFPIAIEKTCTRCRGTGKIVRTPCGDCKGAGLKQGERTVEVTIPAGVEAGAVHSVGRGGNVVRPERPAGDLEITIRVEPHPTFKRVGDDVVCSVRASFAQAALGAEIELPTLEGKGKLRIPPGTQPGSVLRIKGKGIPRRLMGGRGDQLVEVALDVPTHLSDEQRVKVMEMAQALGEEITPLRPSFVEKLKGLFE